MEGAKPPNRAPRTLFSFNTPAEIAEVATGCDADVGGLSTVNFDLDTTSETESVGRPTGKFHGHMRLDVRPEMVGRINSGYAGFKTKTRSSLFGKITDNVDFHDYLALRVRAAGNPVLHSSYFVNVQTLDTMSQITVWQHRLQFQREDNDWETVFLPFDRFQPFTRDETSSYADLIDRERILSVGISVLGGHNNASGPYELGLDSVWVTNKEDIEEDS
ncbi:NADH:ubiquinone oxidoreductase complex I intermediate-associated protein 30, partial [Mycena rebaudengoi]